MRIRVIMCVLICVLLPVLALAHTTLPLDPYGCHSNSALYGTSATRECHADLLAGKIFASTSMEYKAYIAAQKVLLTSNATLLSAKDASIATFTSQASLLTSQLNACLSRCPLVGQAVLTWTKNPEPDVAGYHVYIGTTSRIYQSPPTTIQAMAIPTATVPNLVVGKTYYFAVTAVDKTGNESTFSDEVQKDIP